MFPHRHPWHRIDLHASDVYRDQAFDGAMAARMVSVRKKLWNFTTSRKLRLDALEISAAALALRTLNISGSPTSDPATD